MIATLKRWFNLLLAGPNFFRFSDVLLPWLCGVAAIGILGGLLWGLGFAPSDYQQGESFRIIYVHVPMAWLSLFGYTMLAGAGVFVMVWRARLAEVMLGAIAPVGAVFTALALLTGSLWGKPMWGGYWAWDARLTSELVLLFLYIGVMALSSSFDDERKGARAAALLSIVGVVNVPIIHYSVVWWNSLHQGTTVSVTGGSEMAGSMLWPLLLTAIGAQALFLAIVLWRTRAGVLHRERRRRWAGEIAASRRWHGAGWRRVIWAGAVAVLMAWLLTLFIWPVGEQQKLYWTPQQIDRGNVPIDDAFFSAGRLVQNDAGEWLLADSLGAAQLDVRGVSAAAHLDDPVQVQLQRTAGQTRVLELKPLSEFELWLAMGGYGFFVWSSICSCLFAWLVLLARSLGAQAREVGILRKRMAVSA